MAKGPPTKGGKISVNVAPKKTVKNTGMNPKVRGK